MASLKISTLGSPSIDLDGVTLKFDTRKNVALLAYLAVTGERHSRELLVALLWPELEPSRARAGLRRNLSVLKKALGEKWLLVDREIVGLDFSQGVWLDVEQFQGLLTSWQDHDHQESKICPECLNDLADAVEIYRGDFLAGFGLRDSANFDEWQFFQTENLRRELASALKRLVRAYSLLGRYEAAVPYAQRWLALDPLHESVHRHLMELYAWSDQRAAALRQYGECERILEEELGVPPEEETLQLYLAIKEKREPPAPAKAESPQTALRMHSLPVQPTPFLGREAELAELSRLLHTPEVRLVTILGAGGMGKTRLAQKAAGEQLEHFTHGICFVRLSPLQSVDAIIPTVASALGFSFYGEGEPRQQLLSYLRGKNMLLVLDNFEHLLSGVDLVTEILRTAPDVTILVTSRARLNVQGEQLYSIAGMDFPSYTQDRSLESTGWAPGEAVEYSAIQLFLQSAHRLQPEFEFTPDNLAHVIQICNTVQGMPLAILLAASWVEMLTPAEIAAEIQQNLDFLETDLHDIPERQRSLRAIYDHSWRLLPQREKALFQALSVFRGGFTRQAAEQVVGASLWELKSLINKSLLTRVSKGRYEIPELLRQFAYEKLGETADAYKAAREQHTAYYGGALQQWGSDLKGPRGRKTLKEIELESENTRAAWNWGAEQRQVEWLDRAVEGFFPFYLWRRRYQEGEAACRLAAKYLPAVTSNDGLRVLAKVLMWQGTFNWWLGNIDSSDQQLQRSLVILESLESTDQDVRSEKATVLLKIGRITLDADRERSKDLSGQSLSLFRELGDSWGTANALSALGWAATIGGNYSKARGLFDESLGIQKTLGDQRGIIDSLAGLSFTTFYNGQFEEAEGFINKGFSFLQEIGLQANIFTEAHAAGEPHRTLDHQVSIQAPYQEILGFYGDIGFSHSYVPTNSSLGYIKKHLGEYEEARLQAQTGLLLGENAGWPSEIGFSLALLGELALVEKLYTEAYKHLSRCLEIFRETRILEFSDVLATLGFAARGMGKLDQAEKDLCEAMRIATEIPAIFPLTTAIPIAALLLADREKKEKAVEIYALALNIPRIANSYWFDDIAGRYIAEIAATLPKDVVAAAQARGRNRDLEATVAELMVEFCR